MREPSSAGLYDGLAIVAIAFLLIPLAGLPLFWLAHFGLQAALGRAPNPNNWTAPWFEMLQPMYFGFGPPAALVGLAVGVARARTGHASFRVALLSGATSFSLALSVMMTLWPETEPPQLPYRATEILLVAAFLAASAGFALLVRTIDRSRRAPGRL